MAFRFLGNGMWIPAQLKKFANLYTPCYSSSFRYRAVFFDILCDMAISCDNDTGFQEMASGSKEMEFGNWEMTSEHDAMAEVNRDMIFEHEAMAEVNWEMVSGNREMKFGSREMESVSREMESGSH